MSESTAELVVTEEPKKTKKAALESVLTLAPVKPELTRLPAEWHSKLQAAFWKQEARRLATDALNLQLGHAIRNHQEAQTEYLRLQMEANLELGLKLGTEQDWSIESGDILKANQEPA